MPAGSYVKRMPWGQQKPLLGYGIDWSHPLASGIVGCWLFNEGGGSVANDLANKNHARILAAKYINDELVSSGTGVQTSISNFSIISGNTFTIIINTKLNATSTNKYLFSQASSSSTGTQISVIYGYSAGKYEIYAGIGYTGDDPRTGSQMPVAVDSKYHQIVYVMGNGFLKGYVDSKEIITPAKTTIFNGTYDTGCILSSRVGDASNSSVKSLYVFNRALSAAEIQYLYENPYCMIEGWNYGRYYSIPSSAFINSTYWYQNPILEAI